MSGNFGFRAGVLFAGALTAAGIVVGVHSAAAVAASAPTFAPHSPQIIAVSSRQISRSDRLLITGVGFGIGPNNSRVEIGGITAPVTRWNDTQIAAYIPDELRDGPVSVRIFNSIGMPSNSAQIYITARPAKTSRINWRFRADSAYIQTRPALAPDGTVYTLDSSGHLYALTPAGALKWIASGLTGTGNISVGQDGTIYIGSEARIYALNPNGSTKWTFAEHPGAFILLGPNVGPDGNIYAVATQGMGVFSLTPQGALRWRLREDYSRPIVILQEIVFGPASQSRMYFSANDHIRGLRLDGRSLFKYPNGVDLVNADSQLTVGQDGSVYGNTFDARGAGLAVGKFDKSGHPLWQILAGANVLSTPEVGPEGTIYDGRNLANLYAINPDSSIRWHYTEDGILFSHMVSPLNNLLFVGGVVTYGQPGFFEAISTSGTQLWKSVLPLENGLNIWPNTRARFTPDGKSVYVGTSIAGQNNPNPYCFLYSVRPGTKIGL